MYANKEIAFTLWYSTINYPNGASNESESHMYFPDKFEHPVTKISNHSTETSHVIQVM